MRGLRKHEKQALKKLTEIVMGNMHRVCTEMGVSYTSARRSIKSLEELGHVWMISVGNRGPKSPQTYTSTPLGYLASVVYNRSWENQGIHARNTWVCPRFIHQYHSFSEKGLGSIVEETAYRVLRDTDPVCITRDNPEMVKNQRRNIDTAFITQYHRDHPELFKPLLEICRNDHELLDAWRTWDLLENMRRVAIRQEIKQLPKSPSMIPDLIGEKYPGLTEHP